MRLSQERWFPLILLAVTIAVLGRTVGHDFVNLDDEVYVTRNPMVRNGLTTENLLESWTSFYAANYHPLTWMSLQLDAQLSRWLGVGLHPAVFHTTNLILHVANVLLLYGIWRAMTGQPGRSAVLAALFAVHPLHVESVAWVTERKDVLSTFFWFLTLACYIGYTRRPGAARYALVLATFACGLLSKAMLVTLPFVLLLLDYWPLRRAQATWAALVMEKIPLFALATLACIMTVLAQSDGDAVQSLQHYALPLRMANAALAYVVYLRQTLWPLQLAVYYPHPGAELSLWGATLAAVMLVGITILCVAGGRRRPYLAVGWFWFVGTLVPVIGLVQVGDQAHADRYTYVPLVGLFLLGVWRVADWLDERRCPLWMQRGSAGLVIAVCMGLAWIQVGCWRDTVSLWEQAARVSSRNYRAHASLGAAYQEQGRGEDAVPHLCAALELSDHDLELQALLGRALLQLDRREEAEIVYQTLLAKDAGSAEGQFGIAQLHHRAGRLSQARSALLRAVQLNPTHAEAQTELGWIHLRANEINEAESCFMMAVRYGPRHGRAHLGKGLLAIILKDREQSQHHLDQAARLGQDVAAELREHLDAGQVFGNRAPEVLALLEQMFHRCHTALELPLP